MIRVAAVGDVHVAADTTGRLRPHLAHLRDAADALLLAGDLTTCGEPDEMRVLVDELDGCGVPVVAVLGNHDHHAGRADEVTSILEDAGITVLEGGATTVDVGGSTLGVAGVKGFGGGFGGACATAFGEAEMKAFVHHTEDVACRLQQSLEGLVADVKVALTHYAPVPDTLRGEHPEIFAFLGSYLLGEAVDRGGAHLALHGHAHAGVEFGRTAGGVPVRNVAAPVLRSAYRVYELAPGSGLVGGGDDRPADTAHHGPPAGALDGELVHQR